MESLLYTLGLERYSIIFKAEEVRVYLSRPSFNALSVVLCWKLFEFSDDLCSISQSWRSMSFHSFRYVPEKRTPKTCPSLHTYFVPLSPLTRYSPLFITLVYWFLDFWLCKAKLSKINLNCKAYCYGCFIGVVTNCTGGAMWNSETLYLYNIQPQYNSQHSWFIYLNFLLYNTMEWVLSWGGIGISIFKCDCGTSLHCK